MCSASKPTAVTNAQSTRAAQAKMLELRFWNAILENLKYVNYFMPVYPWAFIPGLMLQFATLLH